MEKIFPKCQLSVEVNPDSAGVPQGNVVIPEGYTVEFEITRQFRSGSQTATFRILNLTDDVRDLIQKDAYALTEYRNIQFRAGYGIDVPASAMPLIFNGRVMTANSYRHQGTNNDVTEISCYDGGLAMANGFTSLTINAPTTVTEVLRQLAKSLPHTDGQPIIGTFPGTNLRGKTLFGNTWSVILAESGNLACIDNNQVKCLQLNEAITTGAEIPVINAESGLLGTAKRSMTSLDFDMIFEPMMTVGQLLELDDPFQRKLSGPYKVSGFTHRGTISPAVDHERITSVQLLFGLGNLVPVNAVQTG